MKAFDLVFVGVAAGLVYLAYYFLLRKPAPKREQREGERPVGERRDVGEAQVVRGEQLVRDRNLRNRVAGRAAADDEFADGEDEEEKDDDGQKNKKQLMKEAKKQEKRGMREGFVHALEAKEKKEADRRKRDDDRELKREEEERKKDEAMKLMEEEQRKREEEEYQKWKNEFAVEEKGLEKEDESEEKNLMQKFVDYIKIRKVVMLEDLAVEFKLSTKDVIDRIKTLEEGKILNGVIDDRGKYIYITEVEMEAIMNFIKQKGRVNRADLVAECNNIIRLDISAKDRQRLMEEESKLLEEAEKELNSLATELKGNN